ncbi:hypothetical protein [Nocardioides sp. Kera G14]|uniref:hypothetical protein n=1 Tax=Nocardioides sp. Kera G14 TaxID=2884264 RepID=UPI001D12A74B|nr:hypothetical protein [Nocardioides sp. Kera G14]UDY23291.1 hypothetical protein LH076_14665 [Nocardioides sp. Kera G14]
MSHLAHYMRTHLAGSTAGVGLFDRAADEHLGGASDVIRRIHGELVEERATLRRMMAAVGVRENPISVMAASASERVSRVRSLARLVYDRSGTEHVELETMRVALAGKLAGWESLLAIVDQEPRLDRAELERLAQQARDQQQAIAELHADAARRALLET